MTSENAVYERAMCEHLDVMQLRLKRIPADKWEWSPAISAPTPKTIGQHALTWLRCDRQHIEEPNCTLHARIAEPESDQAALCEALAAETVAWRALLRELTPDRLSEPRRQCGTLEVNVRWFIYHMIQHVIYKSGQLSEIYFALGLDGEGPYTAPWPNPLYDSFDAARANPLLRAIIGGDAIGIEQAVRDGSDPNEPDADGDTPLKLAACLQSPKLVSLLLSLGADPTVKDASGHTADAWSEWLGDSETSGILRSARIPENTTPKS